MWQPYDVTLPIPQDGRYSYTRLAAINNCVARGALPPSLSKTFSTTNAYALLGIALHRYLELSHKALTESERERLWDEVCAQVSSTAQLSSILPPPPPRLWPGYEAKRISVLSGSLQPLRSIPVRGPQAHHWKHEVFIENVAEALFGIADLVRLTEKTIDAIYDLKSGDVQGSLSEAFELQLGLYGYIAESSLDADIRELGIITSDGEKTLVHDVGSVISKAKQWAFRTIASYRALYSSWSALFSAATPSPDACRGCPLRPVCPKFLADKELFRATGFCSGRVIEVGQAKNGMGWISIEQSQAMGVAHLSKLGGLPSIGDSIAVLDGHWLSDQSIQAQWNSKLAILSSGNAAKK